MLMMYDVGTGFMAAAGQTVPAQQLAADNPGQLNPDDLQKAAREYYTVNGQLLSAPFNTSTPLLYVNTSLLAKARLPATTPLSTLAQIAAVAAKVKSATGVPGFTQPYDGWWVEQLTSASGTILCAPGNGREGRPVTGITLTAPAQDRALSVIAGLYRSGVALDTGTNGSEALAAFDAGKVAMMFNSSGAATAVAKSAGFSWHALPYPVSGAAPEAGPIIGGASLWVSRTGHSAAEQEASWQLISFLDSPASQAAFSQATGYVPVNIATPSLASYQTILAKRPVLRLALDQLEGTRAGVETAGCLSGALPTVRNDVISALQSAFSGSMTLDAALSAGQSKADSDIQSYRQMAGQ
jgi:sn-glycerol 3-phosphate transport system substrate-binding protein